MSARDASAIGQLTPEQRIIRRLWKSLNTEMEFAGRPALSLAIVDPTMPDDERAALVAALPSPEEEAERLVYEEVAEHVGEIMFDGSSSVERDCILCQRGVDLGIWAKYGCPDPFADDEDES